jgi:molybdopterin converting factor small subunit
LVEVTVELLGPSRLLSSESVLRLDLADAPTLHALVLELALRCPALVGPVLDVEREALADGHVFNLNGRNFLHQPDTLLRQGDRVLVLSSAAGG